MKNNKKGMVCQGLAIGILLALEIFYFRNMLFNDRMFGDFGDGRFCILATEHWYQVLTGNEKIGDLRMFYPVTGTFAYSDMFFGFAVPYCIMRLLNINMWMAFKATVIIIHLLGTISMYYLLNRKLKLSLYMSVIGVIPFAYANMSSMSHHPQLYAVYFIPLFAIFVIGYFQNIETKKRILYVLAALISYAVIFYTASYIGYFVLLCVVIFFVCFIITSSIAGKGRIKNMFCYVKQHLGEYFGYLCFGILLLIPYLILYIPIKGKVSSREWESVYAGLPRISELLDVSDTNLLWKNLFHVDVERTCIETELGFPLGIAVLFLAAVVFLVIKNIKRKKKNESSLQEMLYLSAGITVIAACLMIIRLGKGYSLWRIIYKFLPGASSMRAIVRMNSVLVFPFAIVCAVFVNEGLKALRKRGTIIYSLAGAVIGVLILTSYTWLGGQFTQWDADADREAVENVPAPPEDCEVMFIRYPEGSVADIGFTPLHLRAWEIAYYYNTQTINGYTSFYPDGWEKINDIWSPEYTDCVQEWIERYNLKNVYAYEAESNSWTKIK